MIPDPIRLFHITAINNLAMICGAGELVSKNTGDLIGTNYQTIAHTGAQGARAGKAVTNPPGGTIHEYVPFYFAPRSPMLMAINNGRVAGCNLRQDDILTFETTVPKILARRREIVFYDRNATLGYSVCFTDTDLIGSEIAWDLLTEQPQLDGFCKYFQNRPTVSGYVDRMEKRQAEFLVKQSVPLGCMTRIGVATAEKADEVRTILESSGVELKVEVINDWYF